MKKSLVVSSLVFSSLVLAEQPVQFFDPLTGQVVSADELQKQFQRELILPVSVEGLYLGELLVIEDEGYWVNLEEAVSVLDFPIKLVSDFNNELQFSAVNGEGWFIREEQMFSITTLETAYKVKVKDTESLITFDKVKVFENQAYFDAEVLFEWFGIAIDVDTREMLMTLSPTQLLPIQERKLREGQRRTSLGSSFNVQYPAQDVPYQMIGPVFANIALSANQDQQNNQSYRASVLASGDLLKMTGRYFLSTSYTPHLNDQTLTNVGLTLERKSNDGQLLGPLGVTHVQVGDVSSAQSGSVGSGASGLGVRLTNRAVGRVTNANSISLNGLQQPGWQVELYHNDTFRDFQTIGEDGQYNFTNQRLSLGENRFTLIFYGPQGEREEVTETYYVDQASLIGNQWQYDFSIVNGGKRINDLVNDTQRPGSDRYDINVHFEKGIGLNSGFTLDLSSYEVQDGETGELERLYFVEPGVRLFWFDTLVQLSHVSNSEQGQSNRLNLSRRLGSSRKHALSFSYNQNNKKYFENPEALGTKDSYGVNLAGPLFNLGGFAPAYSIASNLANGYDGSQLQSHGLNLGFRLGQFNMANNLAYQVSQPTEGDNTTSLTGAFRAESRFGKLSLRLGTSYDVEPINQYRAMNASLLWRFNNDLRAEFNVNRDLISNADSYRTSLNWYTKKFISSLFVNQDPNGDYSASLSVRFSLGRDPVLGDYLVTSRPLASSGGVSAVVYEDLNNNGVWEQGEPLIEDAEIVAKQQLQRSTTNESGVAFMPGLYSNRATDIELDAGSLADPFWIPKFKGLSFTPRPGLVKTIFIPVVNAGEIEGTARFREDLFGDSRDQGAVPMVLFDQQGNEVQEVLSTFDGFFLFNKVPPGEYWLGVKPEFLERRELSTRAPMPISIGADGTLIMGANFEIFPAGMYQLEDTPNFEDEAFWVDLGTFASENNASTVVKALRGIFPSILAQVRSQRPFEMALGKTAAGRYELKLGPMQHVNNAKIICGALAEEGLHCGVERVDLKALQAQEEAEAAAQAARTELAAQQVDAQLVDSVDVADAVSAVDAASLGGAEPAQLSSTAVDGASAVASAMSEPGIEVNGLVVPQALASEPVADLAPAPVLEAMAPVERAPILQTGIEWLSMQSDEAFSLQLSNNVNLDGLLKLQQSLGAVESYILPQSMKGRRSYTLLVGAYATREQAAQAAASMSLPVKPWIRTLLGVKENVALD